MMSATIIKHHIVNITLSLVVLASALRAEVLTFEDVPIGRTTPIIFDGAFFFDLGFFAVADSSFAALTGHVLQTNSPDGFHHVPMGLQFFKFPEFTLDAKILSVSLNFATFSTEPVPVTLTVFYKGTEVGTSMASGAIPPGGSFPEGILSFNAGVFDSISLSTPASDFAVDNVEWTAAPAAIPEPGTAAMFSISFVMVALLLLRRKCLLCASPRATPQPILRQPSR